MNNPESEKVIELTEKLESDGFKVIVEPRKDDIPFPIAPYKPDLIAYKNGGGIIFEIKRSMKRAPVSFFKDIAEKVALNEGWRFALVTLDDPSSSNFEASDLNPLEIDAIKDRKKKLESLQKLELYSAEIQEAWSLIEACLRHLAYFANIPLNLLPSARLINHLYSSGELTMEQTDRLKELMKLRNKVAHGIPVELTSNLANQFTNELSDLIVQIEEQS